MDGWLWRHVPGPNQVCALVAVALLLGVVAVLLWVFPWLEPRLPVTRVTADAAGWSFSTGLSTGGDRTTRLYFYYGL